MTHRSFDNPNSIEARQHLLDSRCERAHPKRHRTRKRASRLSALKKKATKALVAKKLVAKRKHNAQVRAYWTGKREEHP